jgi:HEAT repeat protein
MKKLIGFHSVVLCLVFIISQCGNHYTSPYDELIHQITDEEMENYLSTVCLTLGDHIGLEAIGTCSQCGGMTPCCNMVICDACASKQGVCPFCLKKLDWTKNTDAEKEIPILLAILSRSDNIQARRVAIYALTQIKRVGTLEVMMRYADEKMLSLELAGAVGAFKDARYIGFLNKVLHYAGDDYFGDDSDSQTQYYISNAAQTAAASLVKIGTDRAVNILINVAKHGKLWQRVFVLRVLGDINETRVRKKLTDCLKEFFSKDQDWKWIPGRDLIGATLQSLAKIGDREAAIYVMQCIKNPGCDFLYDDLKECLIAIGKPIVPELIAAIKEDLIENLYDQGRQTLMAALSEISDARAIQFYIEMLNWSYPDMWSERDFKGWALAGLGKLETKEALEIIGRELNEGKDESIRYAAAHALGQIGGYESFKILEEKLKKSDTQWVIRECIVSLNHIAFDKIKTNEIKLTAAQFTAQKQGSEAAFQLLYEPVFKGESWAISYFFEIIQNIPMQRNFYTIIELLHTKSKKVYDETILFLNTVTYLNMKAQFDDTQEKKAEIKQAFWKWYQEHYQDLR